jgi:hypothetical protein
MTIISRKIMYSSVEYFSSYCSFVAEKKNTNRINCRYPNRVVHLFCDARAGPVVECVCGGRSSSTVVVVATSGVVSDDICCGPKIAAMWLVEIVTTVFLLDRSKAVKNQEKKSRIVDIQGF